MARQFPHASQYVSEHIYQNNKITNHLSSHHVQLPVKEGTIFFAPHLQLAQIAWDETQDWIRIHKVCSRVQSSTKILKSLVDGNDFGICVRGRGSFSIGEG